VGLLPTFWKVYGPDLNGRFGGLQGTGGLEAVVLDADGTTTGVINDQFGNGVASVSGGSVTWYTTRVGAYGPLPGIQAQTLTDVTQVAASTAWRSRRIDPTGFYYLGARYYEPTSGRFLSADPMGQAASPSLYDFAHGDPVNYFDPDGRCEKGTGPSPYAPPDLEDVSTWWNPLDWSWGDWVDAANSAQNGLKNTVGISGEIGLNVIPIPRSGQFGPFPGGAGWGYSADLNYQDGLTGNQQITGGKFGEAGALGVSFDIPFFGPGAGGTSVNQITIAGGDGPGGALKVGLDSNGNVTSIKIVIGVGFGFEISTSTPFPGGGKP
jgi:RHS repeat-associated protein